ncbi:MAG: metal ABC transporter permease [Sphaerochaetaceae bacterium]|nr:metal ABC transporter permease [Sphaerochaetaceae bacterium]MDC7250219.1 metal ABC transporter permease [Sphaerochaetaceae bacterium]
MIVELLIIAVLVAVACAIPGVFLVLKKMSLISDAISHSVLLGIVVGFMLTHSLSSPLLFIGAVITGLLTVFLSEVLVKSRLVKEDAAIGLVFPALFSIGVILVSRYTGNVHLDTDAVLLGELIFTPLDRLTFMGRDLGPRMIWVMSIILIINLAVLFLFFKELKLATFDEGLSASLGFSPILIQYILMIDVSITTVGAFDAVGSILVVALMIVPAATAYLLTDNLKTMVILSIIIGIVASLLGIAFSWIIDASAAGGMAVMVGIIFFFTFLFSPSRGIIVLKKRRKNQKIEFAIKMLVVHLLHHSNTKSELEECREQHLLEHINWEPRFAKQVVQKAKKDELVTDREGILILSKTGINMAQESMLR